MKSGKTKHNRFLTIMVSAALCSILIACGGGGGSSSTPTQTVAVTPPPTPTPTPTPTPPPPTQLEADSSRTGELVGLFAPALSLQIGNADVGGVREGLTSAVFATRSTEDGRIEPAIIAGDAITPLDYDSDDIILVEGDFADISLLQVPSLSTTGLPSNDLSILSETSGQITSNTLNQTDNGQIYQPLNTISVQNSCFIADTNQSSANDVIIGQRNQGLSLFDVDVTNEFQSEVNFTATLLSTAGGTRSLCHILRGAFPFSIEREFPSIFNSNVGALTAVDFNTNELVFYGNIDGTDMTIEELGSTPIIGTENPNLSIVDIFSRGSGSQVPRYFVILLSDGQEFGEHKAVLINVTNTEEEPVQTILHEWSEGVPIGLAQAQFGGAQDGASFRPDLIIALGTVDDSFFFDNLMPLDGNFSDPPIYGIPTTFPLTRGGESAVAAQAPNGPTASGPQNGVLVSYPDTGEIRYVTVE